MTLNEIGSYIRTFYPELVDHFSAISEKRGAGERKWTNIFKKLTKE